MCAAAVYKYFANFSTRREGSALSPIEREHFFFFLGDPSTRAHAIFLIDQQRRNETRGEEGGRGHVPCRREGVSRVEENNAGTMPTGE